MNISDFYPAQIDASSKTFNSIMRSLLIKASFDGILKKITGYRGMYLSEEAQECWTIKFDNFEGVFGLLLSSTQDKQNGYLGEFNLYYFPSPNDDFLKQFSLIEEYIAKDKDFIEKVRAFSSHRELWTNFHVGVLQMFINDEKDSMFVSYESETKLKTYSSHGVLDKLGITNNEYIINPLGIDKNFPAFRVMLPFFNFFNTLLTRLNTDKPDYFNIYKTSGESLFYDKKGNFSTREECKSLKLFLSLGYGNMDFSKLESTSFEKQTLKKTNILYSFMSSATWCDYEVDFSRFNKSFKNKSVKPKLIVVTGFLGSGKTNFLQNYIEYETQKNRFVGIIQNEIGKVGLDGKLLNYDFSLVEIDEGCVCCSLAGQLKQGVATLLENYQPDTILVETTGVANPFNLLSELSELENIVEFDSIVSIVDGVNAKELYKNFNIFKDQIRAADVILLNKIDLMSEQEIKEVEELLSKNNKCANIIKTTNCDISPVSVSLSSGLIKSSTSHISSMFTEEAPTVRTHVDDGLQSIKKDILKPLNRDIFESHLQTMPKDIFRVKGIVEFENEENQFVVQFVNGVYEVQEMENSKGRETFLVYIGRNVDNYDLL